MKFRHNDSGSCSCISCISKNGSVTSLKRIIRVGSRACKLHYGSNIPKDKLRSEIISSSEQEDCGLRRDDAEGSNVLELIRLVDKGEALGHNELVECCSCCVWDPLMAHHTHIKKQRHGYAGRARAVRAGYSSRSSITSRLKELRPRVRFNAKNVKSDPCTCTTTLSAEFKMHSMEMVNKLLQRERQRSMPSESFAREVANKRNKRPVQKYLQKIRHSEAKMKQALQVGAKKSLKKIKLSHSKVMDRQYEISTEIIRAARDNMKRQKRAGSKSSEELEAKLLEDTANLDRKIKSEARNTSNKISKLVKKSKLKLRQSLEPLIRMSAARIQELEAKRKFGQIMCECPGIQAELTKMAKRNLDKHKKIPAEMLDFDKDMQEPKVTFNLKMTNEIKKSARKVADLVQDSQAKLRENVEVLAKKSVEKIKQLDAQRKLLQKTVCECPEIKAELVIKAKQSLNRGKIQSETIPVEEIIKKPLTVKESKTKFKKIVSNKQEANATSTSETNLETLKRFKIIKDSKEKYQEALVKKKALKDWECEPPCFPEKCIPQECYENIIIRKAKLAEMRNINRLGDEQMIEKSLSNMNTHLDAVKKKLKKLHRSENKRNRAIKATRVFSKTSGVEVKANQLEKTKGTNVKKKTVTKGAESKKETPQRKDHKTNQTRNFKLNSVHSMTKFGNAKHAKTSSDNPMRSVSSSASEPKKLRSESRAKRRAKPKHKRSMSNIKYVIPTQRGKKTQDRKQHIKSVSNLVNMKNKTKATKTLNNQNSKMLERNISEYEIPSNESKVQRKKRDRDNQIALNVGRSHFTQSQNSMSEKSTTTTKGLKNGLHKCLCSIKIGTNQYKRMKMKKKGTLPSDQLHSQIFRSSATDTKNAPFKQLQDIYCDCEDSFTQMRKNKLKRRSTNTVFNRRSAGSGTLYRNKKSTSSFTSRSAVFPKNKNVQSAAVLRKSKRSEHKYPEAVISHPEGRGRRAVRISSSFNFSVEIFKEGKPRYIVDNSRTARPNTRQKRAQGDEYTLHKRSRESQHARRRNASKEKGALAVAPLKRCFCTHKLLKRSKNKFNQNKAYAISRGAESSVTRATVKQHFKNYFSKHRRSKTAVPTMAVYRQQTYTVSRVTVKDNKIPIGKTCLTVPQNQQHPALQPGCFNIPRILSNGAFSIGSIASSPLSELLNLKYYQDANKTSICLLPKEKQSHFSLASLKSYAFSGSFFINSNGILERNKFYENQATNMVEPLFLKRCVCTIHFQVPGEGNSGNKRESDECQSKKCESGECVPYNCSPTDCRDVRLKKMTKTGSTILGKKNKRVPSTSISELGAHIVQSTQISLQRSVFGVGCLSETQSVYRQTVENPYKKKRRRPKLLPYECEPGICIPGECDPYECLKLIKNRRTKNTKSQWGGGMQTSSSNTAMDRGSYRRRHAKDEMDNEHYFTTTNLSAKRPRQGVRIRSQFSFNIDFSKSTIPLYEQNYEKEDYVEPKKIKTRKNRRHRDRGSQHERKRRHRRSQNDQSLDTSSTMTNMLKRCICDARVMNESGTQSSSQVSPRYKSTGSSSRVRRRRGRGRQIQTSRDSRDMMVTTSSGHIRRAQTCQTCCDGRNMMIETTPGNLRHSKMQTLHGIEESPVSYDRSSGKQTVRIGSSFSFNVEFSKGASSPRTEITYTPSGNVKAIHTESRGTFAPGVEYRHGSSGMDADRYRSKMTSASSCICTLPLLDNVSPDESKYKIRHTKRTGDTRTGLGPLLKRCFCTLAFKKGNLEKFAKVHTSASTDTREHLQEPQNYARNGSTNTRKKYFRGGHKLMPYECEPGVCIPGECDPYECLKRIERRSLYSRGTDPDRRRYRDRGSVSSQYTVSRGHKLLPYECEPGVCIPGECDPYECLKRIERRSLHSRGTDPDRRQYRGRGSVSSQYAVSRGIKANRRPQQKHRNVGMGRRRQNTVGTASSSYSMSKGTNARRQDRRHQRANTIEGIHYDRSTHVQSSPVSNQRTVRIGSNFSFNIEFCRNTGCVNLEKGMQYEGNNMRDTGVYGENLLCDSCSQADYCTENKKVGSFLKRCFCTLNIQKRARKQVQTEKPYGRYLRSASTQSNLKRYADNVSRERGGGTRNQIYSLEPYECEPNVCIPGECDPYDCYERIQRRLRDQGVASKNVFRELGTDIDNLDTIYTQPYECVPGECDPLECYDEMRNLRNRGTEYDGPSDISIGTMPYDTNASAASQFGRMRGRDEGSGTYRNPQREFGNSPYGGHEFGSSPMGSHEFGSSPRKIDGNERRIYDDNGNSSDKQAVRISSEFSFDVEFFKDDGNEGMQGPARPKLRRDGRTRAVHTKRRRANRGVGERMYYRNNESQMDNSRRSTSTQHDSILKRCFCTLKLQQKQPHKRLITRYPNDQEVYAVETTTKKTSTKNRKMLQKLEPYESEPGFCVPTKCDPQVCLTRIKHRNTRRVTIGTVHKGNQKKHKKLENSNLIEGPCHPNYFSKPRRVVSISSSFNYKKEFLKDEDHVFEDQNETICIKKNQMKLSRFFEGSRSKNKIGDQKQFLKNDRVKSSTHKKPVDSKKEAVVNKKETVVNTKNIFDNKKEMDESRKNQNGNHDIKVDNIKGLNNKKYSKTQKENSKRSKISKQDIKVDEKEGLKNEKVKQIESQQESFVNTKDTFENKIGTVDKNKINKTVVNFFVSTETINKPSQKKEKKSQKTYKHNYNDYLGVSTETKYQQLQKNGESVQKTRDTLSSGKNKHATIITDGVGKKKKRSQKNEEIDEKKIQSDFKPCNKKDLYKNETFKQLTKPSIELKRSCSCVCSKLYCNTEALKKSGLTDSIASSEALKRCFCTKIFQKPDIKLPKNSRVITVGRVSIEQMSSKYFKQSKYVKQLHRNKSSFSKEIVTILPYNSKILNCSRKKRPKPRKHCHPCLKKDKSINSNLLNGNPESVNNLKQLREIAETNNNDSKRLKYNNLKGNPLADAEKQTRSSGIKKVLHRFACFFSRQQSTSSGTNSICEGIKFNTNCKSTKSDPQPETKICPLSKTSKSLKNYKAHRKSSREKHHRPVQHQKQFNYKYDSGDSPQLSNELKYTSKKRKHVLTCGYWSSNNEKSKAFSPFAKDYIVGYCMTKTDRKEKDCVHKCASYKLLNCNCQRNYSVIKHKMMPKMKKKDKVLADESKVLQRAAHVVKPPPTISTREKARFFKSDELHGEENNANSLPRLTKLKSNEAIFKKKNFPKLLRHKLKNKISSECLLCPECINKFDSKYLALKEQEAYKCVKKKAEQLDCSGDTKSLKSDLQRCNSENKIGSECLRCPNCGGILNENRLKKYMMSSDSLRCPNCHEILDVNFVLKECKENNSNMCKTNKPLDCSSGCNNVLLKESKQNKLNNNRIKNQFDVYRCSNQYDSINCPYCRDILDENFVPKCDPIYQGRRECRRISRPKTRCKQNALLELKLDKSTYKVVNKAETTKFLKRLKGNPPLIPCETVKEKEKETFSDKLKNYFNFKKVDDVIFHIPEPDPLTVRLDSDDYCILNKEQTARGLKYWKKHEVHRNELQKANLELRSLSKRALDDNPCVCKTRVCDEEVRKIRRKEGMRQPIGVPCTCGSRICRRRALTAAKRKLYQDIHGKGIPRQEYEDVMKYIRAHKRRPSLEIAWDLIYGKHRPRKKPTLSERWNLLIDRIYEARARRKVASELQKVARRRHQYYEKKMKLADKRVSPEDSNALQLGESFMDLIRLGGTLTESAARLAFRSVMYPSRTFTKIRDTVTCKPKRVKSKSFKTAELVTKSTLKRVGRRLVLTSYFPRLLRGLYRSRLGSAFVYFSKSIYDPKRKHETPPKPKEEKYDFGCSLFMSGLRKRPCMWVYECCPWFYPHCISIISFWKQFTRVLLFLVAIVIWSPCIFFAEACRGLLCCSMCTQ